eukprot:54481_1
MSMLNPTNWGVFNGNQSNGSSTRAPSQRKQIPQNSNGNYDNSNGHYYNHAPDPYARSNPSNRDYTRNHSHNKQCRGQRQKQTQRYVSTQKTADMQMFKEKLTNTFIAVEQAAKM